MITNLVEVKKIKCHQYWPDKDSTKFGPFEVSIIDQQILADYTIRTLIVQVILSEPDYPHSWINFWSECASLIALLIRRYV